MLKRALLGCLLGFAACTAARPAPDTPRVAVGDLARGMEDRDLVIRIPAGTRLPVDARIDVPFAGQEGGAPAFVLTFDRDVYWYPRGPGLVSFDGETWTEIRDLYEGRLALAVRRRSTGAEPRGEVSLTLVPR